jgi:hypothetical protein
MPKKPGSYMAESDMRGTVDEASVRCVLQALLELR